MLRLPARTQHHRTQRRAHHCTPARSCRAFLQLVSTVVLIGLGAPFALPALVAIMATFYGLYNYFMVRASTACVSARVPTRVSRARLSMRARVCPNARVRLRACQCTC